jgi:hypothetical protein
MRQILITAACLMLASASAQERKQTTLMMACAEHTLASATATPASVTTPIKDSATERVGQSVSHYGSAERQKLKLDLDQPVVQGTFASVKGKGTRSGSLNFLEHVYGDCRAAGR